MGENDKKNCTFKNNVINLFYIILQSITLVLSIIGHI